MSKHLWLQNLSLIKETLKKVEDDEDETDETVLNAVKQHQSKQSSHTCMMPQQMETEVVVNTKSTPVTVTADGSNKPIRIAWRRKNTHQHYARGKRRCEGIS